MKIFPIKNNPLYGMHMITYAIMHTTKCNGKEKVVKMMIMTKILMRKEE